MLALSIAFYTKATLSRLINKDAFLLGGSVAF